MNVVLYICSAPYLLLELYLLCQGPTKEKDLLGPAYMTTFSEENATLLICFDCPSIREQRLRFPKKGTIQIQVPDREDLKMSHLHLNRKNATF